MCYAKPGPRCSAHATQILEKAKAAYKADPSEANRKEYTEALEEYKTSPAGIKDLKNAGDEASAEYYANERKKRIAAYKETMAAKEAEEEAAAERQRELGWQRTHDVPAASFEAAQHQIMLANNRLARNGIEERFEIQDVEHHIETERMRDGSTRMREMVRFKLNKPSLKIGGWKVAGRVDVLADGSLIAMTVPEQDLHGWTPEHQECDHCGTVRRRNNTYLLEGPDGEMKQVGSNCLESFTGIRPEGMWALEYDLEDRLNRSEGSGWGSSGWVDAENPTNVVAMALALSDNGQNYRSRTRAQADGSNSTGDMVNNYIHPNPRLRATEDWHNVIARANSEETQTMAQEVLEFARNMQGDSDYAHNLRSLSSQEYITSRHVSFVASAVAAWRRDKDRQERDAAAQAAEQSRAALPGYNQWMGTVGERVVGIRAKVTGVRYIDGQYGTTTLVSMQDEEGHDLRWFASGYKTYADNAEVTIDRATIKKHDEYQGKKRTVLTRAKLDLVNPPRSPYVAPTGSDVQDFNFTVSSVERSGDRIMLRGQDSEGRNVMVFKNTDHQFEVGQSVTARGGFVTSNHEGDDGKHETYIRADDIAV